MFIPRKEVKGCYYLLNFILFHSPNNHDRVQHVQYNVQCTWYIGYTLVMYLRTDVNCTKITAVQHTEYWALYSTVQHNIRYSKKLSTTLKTKYNFTSNSNIKI